MGLLLNLLKQAAGEASLHSKLGFWRQKVSQALDAASDPADFIHSKNGSGDQAGVTADTNIAVETDINVRGITRPDAFSFGLTPGKTYHLIAHGRFTTFDDAVSGAIVLQWVDNSNTAIPSPVPATSSRHRPMSSTVTASEDSVIESIYTVPASPAAASIVRVRCIASTGTATLPQNGMSVTIVEIK